MLKRLKRKARFNSSNFSVLIFPHICVNILHVKKKQANFR
nr:MAG TPA: hypothetical protein [Caudoviricetes sp.]